MVNAWMIFDTSCTVRTTGCGSIFNWDGRDGGTVRGARTDASAGHWSNWRLSCMIRTIDADAGALMESMCLWSRWSCDFN